jgi:hypothetical protein
MRRNAGSGTGTVPSSYLEISVWLTRLAFPSSVCVMPPWKRSESTT